MLDQLQKQFRGPFTGQYADEIAFARSQTINRQDSEKLNVDAAQGAP